MTAYHAWQPLFFHLNGAGYSLYAYEVDTVIPITTFADKDKAASNTWPVILDDDGYGNGVATVYIDETYATLDLRDLYDVSVDGYPANWVKPAQQDEVDSIDARLVLNEATDVAQTEAIGVIQDDIVALDGRLDAAEATIITHTGQIEALQSADTDLDGRLDAAEATIITHTSEIGDLQSADTALDGRLDAAEGTIITHTSEIGDLQSAATALDGRMDAAESTIGTHTSQIGDLQSADTVLDDRLDALEAIDHAPPTGSASSFYDPTAGILVQFGSGTTASNGYAVVTFPTAYTSTPFVVASSDPGYLYLTSADVFSVLTTQFEVVAGYSHAGGGGLGSFGFQWIAIGRKT
jgi:hypothetical protein